jgi:hypothetical protein
MRCWPTFDAKTISKVLANKLIIKKKLFLNLNLGLSCPTNLFFTSRLVQRYLQKQKKNQKNQKNQINFFFDIGFVMHHRPILSIETSSKGFAKQGEKKTKEHFFLLNLSLDFNLSLGLSYTVNLFLVPRLVRKHL